jgi:23S rRNA U2552 (ribose-2'-O)-methylase RlmE/FtsJ
MPKIQFSPEINFGHILMILALISTIAAGWLALSNTVTANTTRIIRLEIVLSDVANQFAATQERDTTRQIELARVLTQLQVDVSHMRDALDDDPTGTPHRFAP